MDKWSLLWTSTLELPYFTLLTQTSNTLLLYILVTHLFMVFSPSIALWPLYAPLLIAFIYIFLSASSVTTPKLHHGWILGSRRKQNLQKNAGKMVSLSNLFACLRCYLYVLLLLIWVELIRGYRSVSSLHFLLFVYLCCLFPTHFTCVFSHLERAQKYSTVWGVCLSHFYSRF